MKRTGLLVLVCVGALSLGVLSAAAPPDERKTADAPSAGTVITNSIGMKLAYIPAGKFQMGSPADEAERTEDEVQHEVAIPRPFYIGVYEVTQREFKPLMAAKVKRGAIFDERRGGGPDHPMENVTWRDAVAYCQVLSALPEEKQAGRRYRLPTEAEWEYACRAGTTTPYNSGKSLSARQANFNGQFPYGGAEKGPYLRKTAKVGSFKPNAWGLYDMHGNVAEWCSDYYDKDYYRKSPKEDPRGPAKGVVSTDYNDFFRVIRGGCWLDEARACRSAYRFRAMPHDPYRLIGFRVVCEVPASKPWPSDEGYLMPVRASLCVALCCVVLLPAGCGQKTAAEPEKDPPAAQKRVTLHVKDMAERLDLAWLEWPNRVEEALSGLPGVGRIDVNLEKNLLHIPYDPSKVTPEAMLEVVRKQGFEAVLFPPPTDP